MRANAAVLNLIPMSANAVSLVLISVDRLLLETLPDNDGPFAGIELRARVDELATGMEMIHRFAPQVTLLDGPSFARGFRALSEHPTVRLGQTRLAVFADEFSDLQLELALSAGTRGLLSRRDTLQSVAVQLRGVASGERCVSPHLVHLVSSETLAREPRVHRRVRLSRFSDRQLEVLIHLAEGKRVKEIAESMHLSPKAIESHKYRVMNRLGIHDRVELCRWAIREGLIQP